MSMSSSLEQSRSSHILRCTQSRRGRLSPHGRSPPRLTARRISACSRRWTAARLRPRHAALIQRWGISLKEKTVLAAALAFAFATAPAYAEDLVFKLDNQSSGPVTQFFVSTL